MTAPDKMSRATLLIIDDSPDDLSLLTEYLREARLRLIVAFEGNEGYQKAAALQPDLILLDVRMPRIDGFATCRLLKADPRTAPIPVIFLSGASELEDRLLGLQLGAVDYISKPFSPDEVMARVGIHLELHRRLQARPGTPPAGAAVEPAAALNTAVRAAMDLLLQNLGAPPSLAELARQVGTNEKRLTELFRVATGLPVFTWLREERVQLACRLLAESEMDIQQVADHVGYGSASNFTTMFRERMGVTPRDYRLARRQRGAAG